MLNNGPDLVADFRRKYDRIVSGSNTSIKVVDIISYLNEAQYLWFEKRVAMAEFNSRARQELRNFEVKRKSLPVESYDGKIAYFEFPEDFYKDLSIVVHACKDCCDLPKEIYVTKVQSDDLGPARQDPHRRASFEYEQIFGDEAGNQFFLYHEGEMEIKEAYLNYLRRPNEIHAASLVECSDGTNGYNYKGNRKITYDAPFEGGSTYSGRTIVDLAVAKAARDKGHTTDYQTQIDSILKLENPI